MEDDFDIRDTRMPESEREYENALRPLSFMISATGQGGREPENIRDGCPYA